MEIKRMKEQAKKRRKSVGRVQIREIEEKGRKKGKRGRTEKKTQGKI